MRKLIFTLGVIALVSLGSCKKEKECKCVSSYSGTGAELMTDVTTTMTIDDGDCSDGNTTVSMAGMTASTTCTEQ